MDELSSTYSFARESASVMQGFQFVHVCSMEYANDVTLLSEKEGLSHFV